jgi:retron-type reverse transcriptase
LFSEIISLDNLFLSFYEFKKGKAKKSDVQEFERNLENSLFRLHEELREKKYKHGGYKSFYITDPKLRHIHKAEVSDRIIHHAIYRILYPIYDRKFICDSYSCRIDKGTHRAVNRLEYFGRKVSKNHTGEGFVLKCDIRKFFDSIDHNILIETIKDKINDNDLIWLLNTMIKSFETDLGKGMPIGNLTSQLFANIYLNELDKFIKYQLKIKYYLRYCDDFLILDQQENKLLVLRKEIEQFLKTKLKLSLHQDKVTIKKLSQGIDFLGYIVFPNYRTLRTKTKRRMFMKVNKNNLPSYLGLLKHCNGYELEKTINKKVKKLICNL